jgi:hypothetical protein
VLQEPELLLGIGERQAAFVRLALQRRKLWDLCLWLVGQQGGKSLDSRSCRECAQGKRAVKQHLDARKQAHRQQGVSSQLKEVLVDLYPGQGQSFGP